jgi:RNA polymerase sigma-70 factor (family 1)
LSTSQLYNEPALLLRIADGDKDAFSLLYSRYWDELYSLALALLKSPSLAEDTIQEVFIKLWLKRSTLPSLQQFKPYFMAMARNEIINSLRQNQKRMIIVSIDSVELAGAPENAEKMNTKEIANSVREIVNTFSSKQQKVFTMSREHGLSHDQIAEQLQISKKTVANLITLSLNEIRNHLAKKGFLISFYYILSIFF